MTIESLASFSAVAVALVTMGGLVVSYMRKSSREAERFARLELKVETMWDFLMRRGKAEAVRSGMATLNSPIIFTQEAMGWMPELEDELHAINVRLGGASDAQLALEIEKTLGDRILKEICIPRGIMMGACIQLAVAIAKNEPRQ